ncbi:hypothetical protein ACFVT2_18040 [Streptomyces sp. NPDC058000]|uniref:hypothetical protein n=1 Tax=Streptomyces sp. NPDC058000 TaxID=3346299 RepID=UPI0036E65B51
MRAPPSDRIFGPGRRCEVDGGRAGQRRNPSSIWWHATLRDSLAQCTDAGHADFVAHALLAAVRADLIAHLVTVEHLSVDEIRTRLAAYVHSVLPDHAGT